MRNRDREVQSVISQVDLSSYFQPAAVTLTMKLRYEGRRIDKILASTNFRHFHNRLSHKLLGSASKRHGKRLKCFPVMESNADGRLHFHAVIDRPIGVDLLRFEAAIKEQWARTDFGYRQVDVQDLMSEGWLSYMLKRRQKGDLLDSIDWENCN